MAMIMTGATGTVAYFEAARHEPTRRAFGALGEFRKPMSRSFARLSAFPANGNHAPTDFDGAVSWDEGLKLLYQIAGVH
ncbi:MAG: hypothetical protein AAF307_02790 [Pseudomonadota bacterium]